MVESIPHQEEPLEEAPTPVFLPGKAHGQRSLVDYSPGGCKESDRPEQLNTHTHTHTHTHTRSPHYRYKVSMYGDRSLSKI